MDNMFVLIVLISDDFHATIERLIDVDRWGIHFKVFQFNSQEPAMPLTDGATGADIC